MRSRSEFGAISGLFRGGSKGFLTFPAVFGAILGCFSPGSRHHVLNSTSAGVPAHQKLPRVGSWKAVLPSRPARNWFRPLFWLLHIVFSHVFRSFPLISSYFPPKTSRKRRSILQLKPLSSLLSSFLPRRRYAVPSMCGIPFALKEPYPAAPRPGYGYSNISGINALIESRRLVRSQGRHMIDIVK